MDNIEKEKLLNEIRITYADCQEDGKSFKESSAIRRLDWKASTPVTTDILEEVLKTTCLGYNEFEPIRVSQAIKTADINAKVYVAREGSVCLYIITSNVRLMRKAMSEVFADEIDKRGSELRVWWD